jgi:hypothetical protein
MGQVACGRRCISLDRDPDHCGACNRVCVAGCVMGACARPQDATLTQNQTCVLYTSGRVFCYGLADGVIPVRSGTSRQISARQITDSIARPLEDVLELAGGDDRACARLSTGGVACFGGGGYVGSVAGISNAVSVSGRGTNFFAATSAGTVFTWPGLPRAAATPATAVAGLTDIVEVAAGPDFGCGRRRDNSVVCWGANASGQLGNGTMTTSATPVAVTGLTTVTQLAAGRSHVCALRSNGTVWCWGGNTHGRAAAPRGARSHLRGAHRRDRALLGRQLVRAGRQRDAVDVGDVAGGRPGRHHGARDQRVSTPHLRGQRRGRAALLGRQPLG